MIRILKENNNLSDKEINAKFDKQKERVNLLANNIVDDLIESIYKMKEYCALEIIQDYIPKFYFDKNNNFEVIDEDDIEERMEQINSINELENMSDDSIIDELKDIILNGLTGE